MTHETLRKLRVAAGVVADRLDHLAVWLLYVVGLHRLAARLDRC